MHSSQKISNGLDWPGSTPFYYWNRNCRFTVIRICLFFFHLGFGRFCSHESGQIGLGSFRLLRLEKSFYFFWGGLFGKTSPDIFVASGQDSKLLLFSLSSGTTDVELFPFCCSQEKQHVGKQKWIDKACFCKRTELEHRRQGDDKREEQLLRRVEKIGLSERWSPFLLDSLLPLRAPRQFDSLRYCTRQLHSPNGRLKRAPSLFAVCLLMRARIERRAMWGAYWVAIDSEQCVLVLKGIN